MIEDFVARVFSTRDAAHRLHLAARGSGSYATHMALGDFYDAIIEKVDAIAEAHQGVFGLMGMINPKANNMNNPTQILKDDLEWFNNNRERITGDVPAIDNLLQDLEGCYMRTIYKLENLQ